MKRNIFFLLLLFLFIYNTINSQEFISAIRNGDLAQVKELILTTPELISAPENLDSLALHFACDTGNLEIVKYLVEAGADLLRKDRDGDTPLHWAAYRGRDNIIDYLLSKSANINLKNFSNQTPLTYAVNNSHKTTIDLLLKSGALVDQEFGITLVAAANVGSVLVIEKLLEQGANLSGAPLTGGSLLHSAANGGIISLSEKVLNTGVDINEPDLYIHTALHLACSSGHLEMVKWLCKNGADINLQTFDKKTPLQIAKELNYEEIVEYLKSIGADDMKYEFSFSEPYFGQQPPANIPQLFAPGIISTSNNHEFAITFSPMNDELYFTRRPLVSTGDQRIWYSKKINDKWILPKLAPFTYDAFEYEPHVTPDGKKLYYGSQRPKPSETTQNNFADIWVMRRVGNNWSEPEYVGTEMMYVTAGKSGTIYYTNISRGGSLVRRVWNGLSFEPEEKLSENINFLFGIAHPCIAPDESFIIYDGRLTRNSETDLYVSFRTENGSWTKGQLLGHDINTAGGEMTASLSPDGKYLFFESDRTGTLSIFWIKTSVINELRP